ncbi:sugar ABC transporter permease [Bifidobacterium miconisargentati]|uniref:sugar ABC transporter permease n=1 Tax=Bifidobacterium miconisargentati TaxID=2834437 RepID=UPI001BDCE3F8|nr:sugar ABC transporter permease [Bifidobacterium miconisargentati]MBW3089154.1 sugar ABC transporter permease [Bifidobacterium miconisargentati]
MFIEETNPKESSSWIQHSKTNVLRWFVRTGWRHFVGILSCAFAGFPILYIVSASLNQQGTLISSNHLFSSITFDNYVKLFNMPQQPFAEWYLNTIIIGLSGSVLSVFLGAMAAYAFSRLRFYGRRVGLFSLILVQMFPQVLSIVAIYLLLSNFGDVFPILGINSRLALILVYLGSALGVNTYLMYGFFNTVPKEIDEAAKIDGSGHARIFFTIILPLVSPILAVVALLSFIATVNEYAVASTVLVSPEKQTLAVGLYEFVSQKFSQNWGLFSAGAVLAAVPVVIVFICLQKYIVSGLTAGAVK